MVRNFSSDVNDWKFYTVLQKRFLLPRVVAVGWGGGACGAAAPGDRVQEAAE
jgi:hypothetical protein